MILSSCWLNWKHYRMDYGNIPGIKPVALMPTMSSPKKSLLIKVSHNLRVPANPNRFYRASKKVDLRSAPRTWRTRVDPFANSWDEIRLRLELTPEIVAREIIQWLMEKYPGEYSMGQTRTPQRRIAEWREEQISHVKKLRALMVNKTPVTPNYTITTAGIHTVLDSYNDCSEFILSQA